MTKARYQQLADTLEEQIRNEVLTPGTKMPTHRAFAEQSNIALATATRTYHELERRGLIVGEAGRGTFVRDPGLPITLGLRQTAADELVDLVFNMPVGDTDADTLRSGLRRLAATGDLEAMLRYQPHGGRSHERKIIAADLSHTHGPVDPERVLVTSGCQHALAITAIAMLKHGDKVATDRLTYPGFKSIASLQGIDLVSVSEKSGVMDPDDLERQCRNRKLRAVYLMPTVHNPLGTVMDKMTRLRLIDVAKRHDLLVIEDSAYAFLESNPPPSLVSLAPDITVHVGGYSKSLATGLRLGYVIAPEHNIDVLLEGVRATTWNAPALISSLVTGWIEDGTLRRSENSRRDEGGERQRLCRQVFSNLRIISHPNAGFAWIPLERGVRANPIITSLKEKGISVSGAEPFATTTAAPQALRLAFGGLHKNELGDILEVVRETIRATEVRWA